MIHDFDDVKDAIKDFEKKFKDKTKNNWKDRANFVPKGLYSMVAMDGNDEPDDKTLKRASKPAEPKKKKKSKNDKSVVSQLDDRVQAFVKRIFDEDSMNESLKRQNIDIKKSALPTLCCVRCRRCS
jgi:poly [ADP-ribose] polymerase